MREETPVRFVLNRLFRPVRPHLASAAGGLHLSIKTGVTARCIYYFLANKSKFARSKINIMYK